MARLGTMVAKEVDVSDSDGDGKKEVASGNRSNQKTWLVLANGWQTNRLPLATSIF